MADPHAYREFDLREIVRALRRRWFIIVAVTALFVGVSLARSYLEDSVYQATATVLVAQGESDRILQPRSVSAAEAQRTLDNEIQLMGSPPIRRAAAERLGHSPRVSVSGVGNTDVVAVRAQAGTPEQAAADATAYAETYIEIRRQQVIDELLAAGTEVQRKIDEIDARVADLERELQAVNDELVATPSGTADYSALLAEQRRLEAELESGTDADQRAYYVQERDRLQVGANLSQTGSARLVSEASQPGSPIKPTPMRNAVTALFVGLLVGVGIALARDYWDDTVTSRSDLEVVAPDVAVLGLIPHVPDWKDRSDAELVSSTQPSSPAAEAYRSLRTSIKFLGIDRELASLQVTSSVSGEGKSTTAANMAVAFARAGMRVIVVDCDLRRPRLHEFFHLSNAVGFTSVLLGETNVRDAVQSVPGEDRLLLLSAGPPPPNPSELLGSPRTAEVFGLLTGSADLVIIDSPPVIPVTDAIVVSGIVDATVLVATNGLTNKRAYGRSVELLSQVHAPLVGTVFNDVSEEGFNAEYGYQYGYATAQPVQNGNGQGRRARRGGRAEPTPTAQS